MAGRGWDFDFWGSPMKQQSMRKDEEKTTGSSTSATPTPTHRCMITHERNQLGERKKKETKNETARTSTGQQKNCSWAFFSHQEVWEQHIQSTQKRTEALTPNTESTSWLQQRERGQYINVLRKTKWSLNNKQVLRISSQETTARCHHSVCCHYWITIMCCLHTCIIKWLLYNNKITAYC